MIWLFWLVNILGIRTYGAVVVVLMILMLAGGAVLVVYGLTGSHEAFATAWEARYEGTNVTAEMAAVDVTQGGIVPLINATAFLFFAYIGFASISQAGGEARDPKRTLPRAFMWALFIIAGYYIVFSYGVYKTAPWRFVYALLQTEQWQDTLTAPHLVGVLMPPALTVVVAIAAALALANDLPPILMAVSRLFFSWARDGIFPPRLADVSDKYGTPHYALTISALVASGVVLMCMYGPERFANAVYIVNMALLTTYCLVGASVLSFPRRAPRLYKQAAFIKARGAQVLIGVLCIITVLPLLVIQIATDLGDSTWAFSDLVWRPTVWWVTAMIIGSVVFAVMWRRRTRQGWDMQTVFENLPDEVASEPAL
jgi:amino acid transporter